MPTEEELPRAVQTSIKNIAVNIALPKTFDITDDGDCVEEWNLFKMQVDNYMKFTGLDKESEDVKISFFLTLISRRCLKEYSVMKIDDRTQFKNVVAAFDDRIIPKRNVIYERYIFGLAKQNANETVDHFVSTLKSLSKTCSFNTMEDELIRDKIVLGIDSNDLRKKLLNERELSLKSAIDICKSFEATEDRMRAMMQQTSNTSENVFVSRFENSAKIRCFKCNKLGHKSNKCHLFRKNKNLDSESTLLIASCNDQKISEDNAWYFDSGATAHITNDFNCLYDTVSLEEEKMFGVANGAQLKCNATGKVKLVCHNMKTVTANDVSFVPGVQMNLLSVSQMAQKGKTVVFDKSGCKVVDGPVPVNKNRVIGTGFVENGLYRFKSPQSNVNALNEVTNDYELWHRRLGHLNNHDLKSLENEDTGVRLTSKAVDNCDACAQGKQHRTPFTRSNPTCADSPLDLVHSDVCGPMQVSSYGGARYFVTFTDDHSRMSHVYFMKTKNQVFEKFQEYKALVENQTGKRIKIFRSDNGTEYVNNQFLKFFKDCGIQFQTTAPYTPQQNGVAERLNRTIVEKARCMLFQAGLSTGLWAEATFTAVYLKNLSPTKTLDGKSPHEIWTGKKPSLRHLRVFGCKVMAHVPKEKRSKWQSKAQERVFIGYCDSTNTYRVCDLKTQTIQKTRDVRFFENVFPGFNPSHTSEFEPHRDFISPQINVRYFSTPAQCNPPEQVGADENDEMLQEEADDLDNTLTSEQVGAGDVVEPVAAETLTLEQESDGNGSIPEQVYNPDSGENTEVKDIRSTRNANPKYVFVSREDNFWDEAMREEIQNHLRNKTWVICDLPDGVKPVKSKWVFKTKYLPDGSIDKYKARLVAKGCSQKEGIDYDEVFAPVVRYNSVRLLLALAVEQNLEIDQMDVVAAFLHPKLDEEIYMELPSDGSFGGKYCKLLKSIYGLKQASRVWNLELDNFLKSLDFVQSKYDPCVYVRKNENSCIYITVYVDDLLIFSNNKSEKLIIKTKLMNKFQMKDLGKAYYVLGYRINYNQQEHVLTLDQRKYVEEMLEKFNMKDCNSVKTPMDSNQVFTSDMLPKSENEKLEMSKIPYQEAIGSLLYLSQGTRPDITFAVSFLSRFNHSYGIPHWNAVKRIFRYLQGTKDYKLTYKKSNEGLFGYCDADWASDTADRKSTTGYVFMLSSGPISWSSKKQPTIALSTTEAEYMALTNAVQESLWLNGLKNELHWTQDSVVIYDDNKGAIDLCRNAKYQARTKHIDVKHHFIRDHVQKGDVVVHRVPSAEMVADVLTKALPHPAHMSCTTSMKLF